VVLYSQVVTPAQAAANELYAFHQCVHMTPEKFADALGISYSGVLDAIRSGELPAIAMGRRKDGAPSKPYRIFRCHAATLFERRSVAADAPQPRELECTSATALNSAPHPGRARRPAKVSLVGVGER
jgi:hypothetical protein